MSTLLIFAFGFYLGVAATALVVMAGRLGDEER
jgi:hypothetical protein